MRVSDSTLFRQAGDEVEHRAGAPDHLEIGDLGALNSPMPSKHAPQGTEEPGMFNRCGLSADHNGRCLGSA